MTSHKEILRLKSLGLTNTDITAACACGRNTVTRTLARAQENGLTWEKARTMSQQEVSLNLFPTEAGVPSYKMPDYEHVHREKQKSGVTLSLLWVEYCEQCRQNGELPYKSTQFNKYYAHFVHKTKATMLKEDNRWVKKTQTIPWLEIEKRYAALSVNRKAMLQSRCGLPWVLASSRQEFAREALERKAVFRVRLREGDPSAAHLPSAGREPPAERRRAGTGVGSSASPRREPIFRGQRRLRAISERRRFARRA